MRKKVSEPIAIVGLGCRYPASGAGPEAFWDMLQQGKDAVRDIPPDRWDIDRFYDPDGTTPGTMRVRQGAFLDQPIDQFDARFYGISPRDAERIDPQQRLLLEVVWEAFENAGIPPSVISGSPTGVYAGGFTLDYYVNQLSQYNREVINQHTALGSTLVMLSNRLSYLFDLHGPSLTIDTACSSSLVAFHYACQDLWNGNTELAVVCGVNVMLRPELTMVMSAGKFLSSDARSKAFDRSADGYGRGEGAGAVILKPLQQALNDGDPVHAVVKATGINQDGRTSGIAFPNGEAQMSLIRQVLNQADIDPEDIVLIEAHGTGTTVGDRTEVSALAKAFGANRKSTKRFIGSVKANIAHQEAVAGIAGVIKTTLCLKHAQVPPQIHVKELNPEISFDDYHFKVARKLEKLPDRKSSPLACVNSFGYGGTNAHVILEKFKQEKDDRIEIQSKGSDDRLLCISARSSNALSSLVSGYRNWLEDRNESDVRDACYTTATRRDHHPYRLAFVAGSGDEFRSKLADTEQTLLQNSATVRSEPEDAPENGLVWVLTGMGPQWWAMGQQLYQQEPVFRTNLQEASMAYADYSGWSVVDEMLKNETDSRMLSNAVAQPANFVLQAALSAQWKHWGIQPSAIVGHSVGEIGAALAAGALDLDQAAQVAYHRSRLQQTMAGNGRLLAAGIDADLAAEICEIYSGEVSIAAINSPGSCALAGKESILSEISGGFDEQGIFSQMVTGELAYHSHQMSPLEDELLASLEGLVPSPPSIPLYSSVTGQRVDSAIHDARYWWRNVRQPVLFQKVMEGILDDGYSTFLQIGPHPVLTGIIRENADSKQVKYRVLSTLARECNEKRYLMDTLAKLYVGGINPAWSNFCEAGKHIDLPTYPWHRESYWSESLGSKKARLDAISHPLLGVSVESPNAQWSATIPNYSFPQIMDHIIEGRPVFPGSGYIETFVEAASKLVVNGGFSLEDINFLSILPLPQGKHICLKTSTDDNRNLKIHARSIGQDSAWSLYATARIVVVPYRSNALPIEPVTGQQVHEELDKEAIYERLGRRGMEYGPAFQSIERACISFEEVSAELSLPNTIASDQQYTLSPILIDGCLQLLALLDRDRSTPLPVGIDRIVLSEPLPERIRCRARVTERDKFSISADIVVTDLTGRLLVRLLGVKARIIHSLPQRDMDVRGLLHQWSWLQKELPSDPTEHQDAELWHAPDTANDPLGMQACLDLLETVKLCAKQPCRLIIITHNSQKVLDDDLVSIESSPLWGAARVARSEYPELAISLVDCDTTGDTAIKLSELPTLGEFAIRQNSLYEHKLQCVDQVKAFTSVSTEHSAAQLDVARKGMLSSLNFRRCRRQKPLGDEIEIRFKFSSINFKDVLKALGKLDESAVKGTFFENALGMEAAGIVERVGSSISDYKVGDLVVACTAPGCLRTHVTIKPEQTPLLKWTDSHRPEEIAGVPIAFITAELALGDIAQLSAGNTVLLHSASGGVGQAAIQVARRLGAHIVATASSEEKRALIRSMGVENVFDSRSLDFIDDVKRVTNGRGVDVALNFLSGDAQQATLSIMAPFGHMVEIGKSDISENRGLRLAAFQENLHFSSVDIDRLVKQRFNVFMNLYHRVREFFEDSVYLPIATEVFPAREVETAFRKMIEARHTGKLTLDLSDECVRELPLHGERIDTQSLLNKNGSYVITGGFGGLGTRMAIWLAQKGATHIVLVGRSGAVSKESKTTIQQLRDDGISIVEARADVSKAEVVKQLLTGWVADAPAVRGIIHCAGVLSDAMISNLHEESFNTVFAAKAEPARLLHENSQSLDLDLDFFVMLSSVSAVLGNSGQANYAAANAYLDGLAVHRRSLGLPTLSLGLGPVSGAGMVNNNAKVQAALRNAGISQITPEQVLQALDVCLMAGAAETSIFSMDWSQWARKSPKSLEALPYGHFAAEILPGAIEEQRSIPEFSTVSVPEGIEMLSVILLEEAARVLRIEEDEINIGDSFASLGMDSLMLVEFTIAVQDRFGVRLGAEVMSSSMSARHLASRLYPEVAMSDPTKTGSAKPMINPDVDSMSDDEVDRLLNQLSKEGYSDRDHE